MSDRHMAGDERPRDTRKSSKAPPLFLQALRALQKVDLHGLAAAIAAVSAVIYAVTELVRALT